MKKSRSLGPAEVGSPEVPVACSVATLESTADGVLVVRQSRKITNLQSAVRGDVAHPVEHPFLGKRRRRPATIPQQLKDPEQFPRQGERISTRIPDRRASTPSSSRSGRIFERYSRPQLVEGQTIGRVWSFRDVTSTGAARSSCGRARSAFASSRRTWGDLVAMVDTRGRRIYSSPSFRTVFKNGRDPARHGLVQGNPSR